MVKAVKYTADFETTTDINDCRVWAYALCEVGNVDNFKYGNSIDDFMQWCEDESGNHKIYFHNLKFDGSFILSWLFNNGFEWIKDKKERADRTFTTLITDMGAFYQITVYFKVKGKRVNKVTFMDSLKILNFSVDQIAKDFMLPISKLKIDYKAKREIGHKLTKEEVDYIRNDVEIMARALDYMFNAGLDKMTIGSDALASYKDMTPRFKDYFPVLPLEIDKDIRESYKGGFTYLSPKYKEKETGAGVVFDVNSMYPAVMCQDELPYGKPIYFEGKYKYDRFYPLYVVRFTCSFKLKKDKIPSIQLKRMMGFIPNEYIETTNGVIVAMTLTNVDLELFFEQYDVDDIEYYGGWKFKSCKGLFTDYIESWTAEKIKAKKDNNGAMYRIAKLMLNSLYGKTGLNPTSRTKRPYMKDGVVRFDFNEKETREPIYIPCATFITSYARARIIHSSQIIRDWSMKNKGYDAYVYSDTDSIHCLIDENDVEDLSKFMDIDDYNLGAWKLESQFIRGKYVRQKCYIEQDPNGFMNVTVAGLPKRMSKLVNFDNFKIGFTTANLTDEEIKDCGRKLTYAYTKGGVVLADADFTIK